MWNNNKTQFYFGRDDSSNCLCVLCVRTGDGLERIATRELLVQARVCCMSLRPASSHAQSGGLQPTGSRFLSASLLFGARFSVVIVQTGISPFLREKGQIEAVLSDPVSTSQGQALSTQGCLLRCPGPRLVVDSSARQG